MSSPLRLAPIPVRAVGTSLLSDHTDQKYSPRMMDDNSGRDDDTSGHARKRSITYTGSRPNSQVGFRPVTSPTPFQRSHSFYHQLQDTTTENFERANSRLECLHELRPLRLIGQSRPLRLWQDLIVDDACLAEIDKRSVRKFYQTQNEIISRYMDVDRLLDSGLSLDMLLGYSDDLTPVTEEGSEETSVSTAAFHHRRGIPGNIDVENSPLLGTSRREKPAAVMMAIIVNFVINFVLLIGKIVVAMLTNSLSILASLVDSALDFLSTLIIWFSTRLVGQKDFDTKQYYPVGRNRLEPIGVLVFSVIIIVSFLKIADEALTTLISKENTEAVSIGWSSTLIMGMTVVVKIFCWLWCRSINSSAVQALAQDAMTDIIFNVFSILFPIIGYRTKTWWLDPLGALFLSCYIVLSWGATALEHIGNLTGSAASPEERQMVLYMCMRYADCIRHITALNAYHTGDRIIVEVDVILSQDLSLKDLHDIAESLQYAIETLPFVERAFVHLDYRTGNYAGHLDQ